MRFILLSIIAFSCLQFSLAQTGNPQTKAEIEARKKELQKAMDQLTPEQKKMMEQMGVPAKIPSMAVGVSDADIKAAVSGGSEFGVPVRNAGLIAAIPSITLSATTLPAYIKSLNAYIEKGILGDSKIVGEEFYSYYKKNQNTAEAIGNMAIGFWSTGQPEIAVYIMGKACSENSTDADLLSNLAAMLSMGGAPHRAIPILEYLVKLHPDNTTILNNLGQAWFYLGETEKANLQLERAVKAFAYHPQANYTQCLIQQSKGNTQKAIEKMKNSLAYSFSGNKVNMLQKLGYKVKASDLSTPFHPDPNPLGLRNFVRPDVPVSYADELRLSADWDAFQQQVHEKNIALAQELVPYQQAAAQQAQKMYNQHTTKEGLKAVDDRHDNIYRRLAEKKLGDMNKDGGASFRLEKAIAKIDSIKKNFLAKDEPQRKRLEKEHSIIADQETELAKKGENIGFDNCEVQAKYSEWVYTTYNKPLEEAYQYYLHQLYLKISEELYWKQFSQDASTFATTKIVSKKTWLGALGSTRYLSTNRYGECTPVEDESSSYRLADFDEMNCKYKSTLDFKVYKQVFECGKAHIEFDAGKLSGKMNFKFDDKGKSRFVNGTVESNIIDKSIKVGKGPLQAGASVKAGMGIEFSSNGVEDVYVNGEAKITAGSDTVNDPAGVVSDPSITIASASGRMSLISGSMTGAISGFGK